MKIIVTNTDMDAEEYYDNRKRKRQQEELIFHLYIAEGALSDETLDIHRQNPKVKDILEGLSNDEIRRSAQATADKMNKKIGKRIY